MRNYISEEELLQMINSLNLTALPETPTVAKDLPRNDACDGTVEVKDNQIRVTDPQQQGTMAVIQAVHPVQLFVNDELVTDKTVVVSQDKIEWSIERKPLFQIDVSPDKMKAWLTISATKRYAMKLKDKAPQQHLILEAEELRETIEESLTLSDILKALQSMGITKNIKSSEMFKAIASSIHGPVLAAEGYEGTPPVDAEVELFFDESVQDFFEEIDGAVDFKNHLHIPSVKAGDRIAKKHPPKAGTAGYNVYGESLTPRKPKDITIVAKDHVEITENGDIIALKEGRPRMTGTRVKQFDISPAYVVSGNVDLEMGNIVFSGDVIVYGSVMDGMIIESLGNIYVSGSVYRSRITATGSIYVKGNVVGCELNSGYFGVLFNRLYANAKSLCDALRQMIEGAELLMTAGQKQGKDVMPGQAMMLLAEKKFPNIRPNAKEILNCITSIQMLKPREMEDIKEDLQWYLQPVRWAELKSLEPTKAFFRKIQEMYQSIERLQETFVVIDIQQCHRSQLKSNGNILIRGEGVIQSSLFSIENIVFHAHDSVCRGSDLEAGGVISVMTVGGTTGGETRLKAGKKIMLQKMFSGRLQIGNVTQMISEPIQNVTIRAIRNELVMESCMGHEVG